MADSIGQLIKQARIAQSLSQGDLAGLVEVTNPYICRLEKDQSTPSDELCIDLARVLKLDTKDLRRRALEKREGIRLEDLFPRARTKNERELMAVFSSLSDKGRSAVVNLVLDAHARGEFELKERKRR